MDAVILYSPDELDALYGDTWSMKYNVIDDMIPMLGKAWFVSFIGPDTNIHIKGNPYSWDDKLIKSKINKSNFTKDIDNLEKGDIVFFHTQEYITDNLDEDEDEVDIVDDMIQYLGEFHQFSDVHGNWITIYSDSAEYVWNKRLIGFVIKKDDIKNGENMNNLDDKFILDESDSIKADGITVRCGNKVLKLTVTGEESLVEDDIRKEYEEKIEILHSDCLQKMSDYKSQMKSTLMIHKKDFKKQERELQLKLNNINDIPLLSEKHAQEGLSVISNSGGFIWYFKCVYQPKFINERVIDPKFASRLMTPIQIEIKTDKSGMVYNLRLIKIIGNEKFSHYHATGSTDCWGDYNYTQHLHNDPDMIIKFCHKVQSLLEVINSFSLGTDNPNGLSRIATLNKHIIKTDMMDENPKKSSINSRNSRSGFDQTVNEDVSDGWST